LVFQRQYRSHSLISNKNAFHGEMGQVEEQFLVQLESVSKPVHAVITTNNNYGSILSYFWYEDTEGIGTEVFRAFLALDQSPLRRPGGALMIRLTTPNSSGKEVAGKRLRDFLAVVRDQH